jgi:hypothetical protein
MNMDGPNKIDRRMNMYIFSVGEVPGWILSGG